MNGAGNEILVLDLRGGLPLPMPKEARAIHAAPGLDYDQMMVIADPRSPDTLAYVPIYNNDGSLSGACGNGTRCVADRLARETARTSFCLETEGGLIACERLAEWTYRVDMGSPRFGWREIPSPVRSKASTPSKSGSPTGPISDRRASSTWATRTSCSSFPTSPPRRSKLSGPRFETHPLFPQKVNVSFAEVVAPDHIRLRVWERGVGSTLACGSAACATLVAAARRGLTGREARVSLPGGELVIAWRGRTATS